MAQSNTCTCSNLKVMQSFPFREAGYSGFTMGGTTTASGWPQNTYWQNTKLDKDGGRPVADLMDSCRYDKKHK